MYTILDGKATSAKIKQEVAEMVADYKSRGLRVPHLTAILVGHDGGSETYVANKAKTCHEVGFTSEVVRFEDDVTEETLLAKIAEIKGISPETVEKTTRENAFRLFSRVPR